MKPIRYGKQEEQKWDSPSQDIILSIYVAEAQKIPK